MNLPTPENTTARDPLMHLLGVMSEGTSDYITGMEAAGQRQLVNSDTLPTQAPWDELEALGFVPGEEVAGDAMFRHCALPSGWAREGSDHAMWSYIVDERGVRRVAIFYKAAFYDRRANASIQNVGCSLSTESIYGDGPATLPASWGLLTEDERGAFAAELDRYLVKAEGAPDIYGDRAEKVRLIRDLIHP